MTQTNTPCPPSGSGWRAAACLPGPYRPTAARAEAVSWPVSIGHSGDAPSVQMLSAGNATNPEPVNLRIRAINCYLEFLGMREQRLSMLRIQQQTFLETHHQPGRL